MFYVNYDGCYVRWGTDPVTDDTSVTPTVDNPPYFDLFVHLLVPKVYCFHVETNPNPSCTSPTMTFSYTIQESGTYSYISDFQSIDEITFDRGARDISDFERTITFDVTA